jgi:uncharacterized membrane protein
MTWAIFPIIAQAFYVSGCYVQNYLVDTALPKKRPGALIISHLPCMILGILILFAIFGRMVFFLPLPNALGLIAAGAINVIGAIFYYRALQAGDTADLNIIGQLSPLLSLALGIFVLGEVITFNQAIGFAIVMAAILVVMFGGSKQQKHKTDWNVIILALCSMFFSISSDIVFAYFVKGFTADVALFARSFFFFELGSALMITIITICFGSWRKAIKTTFFTGKQHRRHLLASIADNLLYLLAEFIYKYGLLIVPVVAMMTVVGKVASLFVSLFYTIFVGKIFPKFIHGKRLTRRIIAHYIIAAILIIIGIGVMN